MHKPSLPHAPADSFPPAGAPAAPQPDPYRLLSGTLDADALERLRELDPSGAHGLLPRVLRAFDESLERGLKQVAQARDAGDLAALRQVAHMLKSSAASVGALELSRICADIERKTRDQETEGLRPLLDDMVAHGGRLRVALAPALSATQ